MAITVEARKAYNKAYGSKNKEKINAQKKEYYLANKEVVALRNKLQYQKNKETRLANQKIYNFAKQVCIQTYRHRPQHRSQECQLLLHHHRQPLLLSLQWTLIPQQLHLRRAPPTR